MGGMTPPTRSGSKRGGEYGVERATMLAHIDAALERLVISSPQGERARPWSAFVAVLLGVAFLLRVLPDSQWMADLFVLPILLAGFVLRVRGLWSVPCAVVLYHVAEMIRQEVKLEEIFINDLLHLAEWGLLSAVILVTLEKYVAIRQLQQRTDKDLELARVLQSALTVPDERVGKLELKGFIHQCNDVGGDFYYFRPFQKKYVLFCLGDVMGKGISASLLMSMAMSFMFEWGKKSTSPQRVLSRMNHRLHRLWHRGVGWYLTLFYAVFDEETSVLRYANGGHQSGLVVRADGRVESLDADGMPLGVMEDTEFEERSIKLEPGDRVLLFTDGVTEARNCHGELFGVERLKNLIRGQGDLLRVVREEVLRFTGDCYTDDMALLAVKVMASGQPLEERERS